VVTSTTPVSMRTPSVTMLKLATTSAICCFTGIGNFAAYCSNLPRSSLYRSSSSVLIMLPSCRRKQTQSNSAFFGSAMFYLPYRVRFSWKLQKRFFDIWWKLIDTGFARNSPGRPG